MNTSATKKSILLLVVNLLTTSILYSQSCLIADFPFNGNANDVSGNGNNGAVTGAALITGHDGTINSAYFFDAIDDVITTNNSLGSFASGEEFTIGCWIKTTLQTGTARFISKRATCSSGGSYFSLSVQSGKVLLETNDNSTFLAKSSNIMVNDGEWHHIALVRTDAYYAVFIDGMLGLTLYTPSLYGVTDNTPLEFGNDVCVGIGQGVKFTGSLDDIKIFNCALGVEEITKLLNDGNLPCTVYDTVSVAVTDTLVINVVLSVSPPVQSTIKVYPNPTNNLLIIDNSNYAQMNNYTVKILNSLSQQIFFSPFNVPSITVDLNQFGATGVYLLQILNPANNIVEEKRIILQ